MLKRLILQNLILVEKADLEFEKGLTAITGETGSGKTALLEAIKLILGERSDTSKIRKNSEKASVLAVFENDIADIVWEILDAAGIACSCQEPLVIFREIFKAGKNRSFICSQPASMALLAKIGPYLIDFVGQHMQLLLKKHTYQRHLLDQFAKIDLRAFCASLQNENSLSKTLKEDRRKFSQSDPLWLSDQLEKIDQLAYESKEEEALFNEISLLSNAEEIQMHASKASELTDQALTTCHALSTHLNKLPIDEAHSLAKEIKLQLAEISSLTTSLIAQVDSDPSKLSYLEERLSSIETAKKRFGTDLIQAKEQLKTELDNLSHIEKKIAETEKLLKACQKETNKIALEITAQRKQSAAMLSQLLSEKLKSLNIEDAQVLISIEPTSRTHMGDDLVIFHLCANRGEKMIAIQNSASGGEIARLLFCLKWILSNRKAPLTLFFDEVDAGVGGETATLMGSQLSQLAENSQILCITHFPQVARFAKNHLRVSKWIEKNRTQCEIRFLNETEKEDEFRRMLGGVQMTLEVH